MRVQYCLLVKLGGGGVVRAGIPWRLGDLVLWNLTLSIKYQIRRVESTFTLLFWAVCV